MPSYVAGEKIPVFCSSNFIVPSVILTCHFLSPICLLFSMHVLEWLLIWNFATGILGKLLLHTLILNFSSPQYLLYFHIVCKGWAEKKVLERFQIFRKGTMKALSSSHTTFCPRSRAVTIQGFPLFSSHCMFPSNLGSLSLIMVFEDS